MLKIQQNTWKNAKFNKNGQLERVTGNSKEHEIMEISDKRSQNRSNNINYVLVKWRGTTVDIK